MLLPLNNDCLRIIMKMLSFKDQIACAVVCERLEIIVTEIWKPKEDVNINMKDFKDIPLECFAKYMSCISEEVERLVLTKVNLNHLKDVKFPNVHTLIYGSPKNHSKDSEILMKNIFPQLQTLSVVGCFTGKLLQDLENLEILRLEKCRFLKAEQSEKNYFRLPKIKKLFFPFPDTYKVLHNILKDLVLWETLDEIIIEDSNFLLMSEELFKLKNLRRIGCRIRFNIGDVFEHTIDKINSVLHTVIFVGEQNWLPKRICENIQKLIALRKLVMINMKITADQLCAIGALLSPTLEEFYYRNICSTDVGNYDGLLEIVRQCRKLKIFDLNGTGIDLKFVRKVAAIIASEKDNERKEVLVMKCSRTYIEIKDLKKLQLPKKLRVSFLFKDFQMDCQKQRYIYFEWNPTNNDD